MKLICPKSTSLRLTSLFCTNRPTTPVKTRPKTASSTLPWTNLSNTPPTTKTKSTPPKSPQLKGPPECHLTPWSIWTTNKIIGLYAMTWVRVLRESDLLIRGSSTWLKLSNSGLRNNSREWLWGKTLKGARVAQMLTLERKLGQQVPTCIVQPVHQTWWTPNFRPA